MALKFIDGFDHYAVGDIGLKWSTGSASSMQTGRSGSGQCVRFNNSGGVGKTFASAQSTWTVGFAFRINQFVNGNRFLTFDSSGTNQVNIRMTNTGQLQIFRNNTLLGDSGANVWTVNTFFYMEVKVVCSSTVGTVEIKVNGTSWVALTGKNTDNAGSTTINGFQVGMLDFSNLSNTDFDDLYICDGTGSANTTFIGDVAVQTLYPTAAGDVTNFTPSTGSNWQNVDDATLNKDTDYNSDATAGDKDLYNFGNLTGTIGSIVGVQKNIAVRKDDAGTRTVKSITKSAGTIYEGTAVSVADSYLFYSEILETDPATSAAWTETNIDAAQFGIKLET